MQDNVKVTTDPETGVLTMSADNVRDLSIDFEDEQTETNDG